MSSPSDGPSLETVFDLLNDQRRRYVLACLSEHESLTLADLAEEVTRLERDTPISDVPEEEILRVYLSLWHAHVPKLADAGVLAYDQDRDLVRRGENTDHVEDVVSLVAPAIEETAVDE